MTFNFIAAAWFLIVHTGFVSGIGLISMFQGGWTARECVLFPVMWLATAICIGIIF